jgi:adenylate cyclase
LLKAVGYLSDDGPWLALGVGVYAGVAYVGNIGGEGVVDFTALGDTVNVAARLQALGGSGEMIVGEGVHDEFRELPHSQRRIVEIRGHDEHLIPDSANQTPERPLLP